MDQTIFGIEAACARPVEAAVVYISFQRMLFEIMSLISRNRLCNTINKLRVREVERSERVREFYILRAESRTEGQHHSWYLLGRSVKCE